MKTYKIELKFQLTNSSIGVGGRSLKFNLTNIFVDAGQG